MAENLWGILPAPACESATLPTLSPALMLCDAASRGDVPLLRKLAKAHDSSVGDYDQRTAMHLACSEGQEEAIVVLLKELGANINSVDRWGGTPYDDAVRSGHSKIAMFLSSLGAQRGSTSKEFDPASELCDAAARADARRLRFLVRDSGYDVNTGDYDQRTACHLAASEGLLDTLKCLVDELGADHSLRDRWGGTPLDDAVRSEHSDVVKYLEARGARKGMMSMQQDPATELCDAAARADVARLRLLVSEKGYDVDAGDYDQRTAIHLACSEGQLAVVQLLVEELGAAHSPLDRWGGTPLNDAIRHKHGDVAAFLTKLGTVQMSDATEQPVPVRYSRQSSRLATAHVTAALCKLDEEAERKAVDKPRAALSLASWGGGAKAAKAKACDECTSAGVPSSSSRDASFAPVARDDPSLLASKAGLPRRMPSALTVKYGHFKGSRAYGHRHALWALFAVGLAIGSTTLSFVGFPLSDVVAEPSMWWQCLLPCASVWSLLSAAMVSMTASVIMMPSEPPLHVGRWAGLSVLTSWAMIVTMALYHLLWTRGLGFVAPAPWLGGLPGGVALLTCLLGAWWVHSEPWQRASPTERRRWKVLIGGLLCFWLSLPIYWTSLLAFKRAGEQQWLVALVLVPSREVALCAVRHFLRGALAVEMEEVDDPTADVLAVNLTLVQHTLFLSCSVGSVVTPFTAVLQVLCDLAINLAQTLVVVRERRQIDRLIVPGADVSTSGRRGTDATSTTATTATNTTSAPSEGGANKGDPQPQAGSAARARPCDAMRRRLLALCLGDVPSHDDQISGERLRAKKQRAVRSLLAVVLSETIEVLVPLTYLATFLCLHYGRNAHAIGNVGSSLFLFDAGRDIGDLTRFLLLFVAADTCSLVVVAAVLWCQCSVSVWRVYLFLQEQYGAVLAVQFGWAVNQQFCAIAIGCAIDVSFGHWIENWESIRHGGTHQDNTSKATAI